MKKNVLILCLLIGFSMSSQNNLITNSSFTNPISDYAGINGASEEWFVTTVTLILNKLLKGPFILNQ